MVEKSIHLGDGAYASVGRYRGEIIITANHHDPDLATDRVYLEPEAVRSLAQWLISLADELRKGSPAHG